MVIGVPEGYDLVRTTKPYYRSTYVFVYPKGKGLAVKSLDDPVLKKLKIGVHLLGDDYTNPPPVHELSKRGVVDNVVGFSTFYSAENPPSSIIDAVASGKVDRRDRLGAGGWLLRQAAARAAGAGSGAVRKGRPAIRLRHLDGRQARQRRAEGARGEGARQTRSRDHEDPEGIRRAIWWTRTGSREMTTQLRTHECRRTPVCRDGRSVCCRTRGAPGTGAARRRRRRIRTRASTTAGSGGMCTVTAATASTPSARRTRRT